MALGETIPPSVADVESALLTTFHLATTAALAAGGWAAAAYLDAKLHLRKDLQGIYRVRRGEKLYARAMKQDRVSLFYVFEDRCKKQWNDRAIWWRERSYTFGEMYQEVLRYAQWMIDEGIEPGELVGMYLTNSPHFMIIWHACMAIGAAPAFINYNLEGTALMHCLAVCQTRLLIVDDDANCQQRINASRAEIEAQGMKIAVLDHRLKQEIESRPLVRPGDELRAGTKGSFPFCLIYTR